MAVSASSSSTTTTTSAFGCVVTALLLCACCLISFAHVMYFMGTAPVVGWCTKSTIRHVGFSTKNYVEKIQDVAGDEQSRD
jgi:hypothetical protein